MRKTSTLGRAVNFTPALGTAWLTPLYDVAIRCLTSEKRWRSAMIAEAKIEPDDRLIDVGSGTGSLLIGLRSACPQADLLGVDPDRATIDIARRKAAHKMSSIRWHHGFLDSLELQDNWRPNKIVSSLLFHQIPAGQKEALIEEIWNLLEPGGMVLIADYMKQENPLMRALFRATVQRLDGSADTQPNAAGVMENLISARFIDSKRLALFNTPTGAMSLWRGFKERTLN